MARWLLLLAAAGAMCAQTAPKRAFTAQDDKALEAEIRARLANSTSANEGFTIRVQGGVAYWDGETSVAQRKGAATRMARSAGALRVENRIRVTAAGKQKLADDFAGKNKDQAEKAPPAQAPGKANTKRSDPPEPRRVRVQWRERSDRR